MTSIDFGLAITAYGAMSVFAILLLIVIFSEALKRGLREEAWATSPASRGMDMPTEEEMAAISAAISSYLAVPSTSLRITDLKPARTMSSWSHAGRLELIKRRLRRL